VETEAEAESSEAMKASTLAAARVLCVVAPAEGRVLTR
jgi:hypothetical protein